MQIILRQNAEREAVVLTAPFRKVIATRRLDKRSVAEEEELAWYHRLIIIKRIIKIEIFRSNLG